MASNHKKQSNNDKLDLKRLKKHRDEILKAETAGLLFNLGKTHIGIGNWKKYFDIDEEAFKSTYGYGMFGSYKKYHQILKKDLGKLGDNLSILLEDTVNLDFLSLKPKFKNVLKQSGELWEKIFLKGCENVNSGIDKGYSPLQSEILFISNAFGSYRESVKESNLDQARIKFLKKLDYTLSNIDDKDKDKMIKVRNFVFAEIKQWYSHLLSDSRYPMNDVTLWDQTYMTTSMFKSAIASRLLGKKHEDEKKIRWSIMGIQYDKLALTEKALRIHFIHAYKQISNKIDDAIKELIELEYALGNEIYRDETGIYFLVPENLLDNRGTSSFYQLHPSVKKIEKKILCKFTRHLQGEMYPAIFLTKPSRGIMNLSFLLHEARKHHQHSLYPESERRGILIKNVINLNRKDTDKNHGSKNTLQTIGRGVCQVCRIRLANEKIRDLHLCDICKERYQSRTKSWTKESAGQETIWTGEVQDRNGRIALITMKFELFEWINGNLINSLLMNRAKWKKTVKEIAQDLKKMKTKKDVKMKDTQFLKNYVDKSLRNKKEGKKELTVEEFCHSIILERTIGDTWEMMLTNLFPGKISFSSEENNGKIDFDQFNEQDYETFAAILLQFLLRKNPSPARLRRVWESTQTFLEDMRKQLLSALSLPYWRCHRLVWEFKNSLLDSKNGRLFQYEGIDFWVSDHKVFLISSIEKAAPLLIQQDKEIRHFYTTLLALKDEQNRSEKLKLWLKDSIKIECPDTGETVELCQKDVTVDLEFYKPVFSITDPSPVSWQVAVPAEYSAEFIRSVQSLYRKHFKFVEGKLPLHIGVIVQDYKKPLYVGIKALRRIRRDIYDWEDIRQKVNVSDFLKGVNKSLSGVPAENLFSDYSLYPVQTTKEYNDSPYTFYLFPEQGKQHTLLPLYHITESSTEAVDVYPNTIDFEYLDVNTRRNDIYYDTISDNGLHRVLPLKQNRPYTWSDWDRFEKFLDFFANQDTKLHHLVELIYGKLQDWEGQPESVKTFTLTAMVNVLEMENDSVGKDRLANLLGEASWKKLQDISADEWVKRLQQFLDMFEFWHTALKRI